MSSAGAVGWQAPADGATDYTKIKFQIEQLTSFLRTAVEVTVTSVTPAGIAGLTNTVGLVSVQPLVNMIDGEGNATPHGIVNNLPYFRLQGGNGGIVVDPVVGDNGLAIICDRDTSSVIANQGQANPGSYRRNDMADGFYFGGNLNQALSQYIQFASNGINIKDINGNTILMRSAGIMINGITIARGGSGTGASGTFTSQDGKTITVDNGIITGIH